jgi:hypothetical protein
VISIDFASRLTSLQRMRRKTYTRGFWHGVVVAIVGVLFFAWYFSVGGMS